MALLKTPKPHLYTSDRFLQPVLLFEATNYTKKHEFVFKGTRIPMQAGNFRPYKPILKAQKSKKRDEKSVDFSSRFFD